jgi:SAM-dependent methyltransferase
MSAADRQRWDAVYRRYKQGHFPEPDPFLLECAPPATGPEEARALDLAGGLGQNGLWLADQGYTVDVIDISRLALVHGRAEMTRRGLRNINFLLRDLDEIELEPGRYRLVCVFRYLKRDLFQQIRACIQPGGRLIYETYNTNYLNVAPDFNPDYLLAPGELAGYFADWRILQASDTDTVSRLAAIRPTGV